jgi:nucleotide-binding universal stress UspA family protein
MVPGASLTDQLREERSAVREAEHRLRASLARARERHPETAVDGTLLKDPEPQQVADRLTGATLLVVGTHSAHGLPAFALDSPSMQLAEAVSCPVVCVPDSTVPHAEGDLAPVVVGVDSGALAVRLLRHAGGEAQRRSTGLVVVHGYRALPGEDPAISRARARAAVLELVRRSGLDPRTGVTINLTDDPADAVLADWSRQACLLVTGTRGMLALAGLTPGSVSRALLDSAACPVLVLLERVSHPVGA